MKTYQRPSFSSLFNSNWKSGVTVGLVSLPLAVSLAVAANTSPVIGIITAIWAGFVAALFGGSNYNIIGPTGALAGILFMYAGQFGPAALSMLAILSGIMIFVAYLCQLERYLIFIPGSALHGFILGVALIVILNQVSSALGIVVQGTFHNIVQQTTATLMNITQIHWPSFIIFVSFLAGLFFFKYFIPRLPGIIVLSPVGILLGYLASHKVIPYVIPTLADKYPPTSTALFCLPSFSFHLAYLFPAVSIAIIAILETMISARIADGATKTKHDKRKEMLGLSLANIASGFAGGIPATAALARTSLNIKSGGSHKMSAAFSSLTVALISLVFITYFYFIPLAVIAAMLIFVSIGMLEMDNFLRMFRVDKKNFAIALIVAFITLYEDAIVGILFGSVVAMLAFMEKLATGYHEVTEKGQPVAVNQAATKTLVYSIKGPLAYINTQAHLARLEPLISKYNAVILNLHDVHFVDLDGIEAFGEIVQLITSKGKKVYVADLKPVVQHLLQESHVYRELAHNGQVYASVPDALAAL